MCYVGCRGHGRAAPAPVVFRKVVVAGRRRRNARHHKRLPEIHAPLGGELGQLFIVADLVLPELVAADQHRQRGFVVAGNVHVVLNLHEIVFRNFVGIVFSPQMGGELVGGLAFENAAPDDVAVDVADQLRVFRMPVGAVTPLNLHVVAPCVFVGHHLFEYLPEVEDLGFVFLHCVGGFVNPQLVPGFPFGQPQNGGHVGTADAGFPAFQKISSRDHLNFLPLMLCYKLLVVWLAGVSMPLPGGRFLFVRRSHRPPARPVRRSI